MGASYFLQLIIPLPFGWFYGVGSSKISKVQNFLDQDHFQEGMLWKNDTFFKILIWEATFSHLLQNLELALKFQISDKKAIYLTNIYN